VDKHYDNIRSLIENNLIYEKKQELSGNYHRLMTYYNVRKLFFKHEQIWNALRSKLNWTLLRRTAQINDQNKREYQTCDL
jgi:hypothetical protein